MKGIKKYKNIIIICASILALIGLIIGIVLFVKNYNNYGGIKYQVFAASWKSSFKKDGEKLESKEAINGIKLITTGKYDGLAYTKISNDFEEKTCYTDEICTLEQKIEKISFNLTDTLKKKYDIYYRIYSDNKWSKWGYNSEVLDAKDKGITKIQIKLVPKDSYLEDYLEDYEVINNEE